MRRLIIVLALVFGIGLSLFYKDAAVASFNKFYYVSTCDNPIRYKVGIIDDRFNITQNEFLVDIRQASSVWSTIEGKNLFVYDPKGILTINLVYDRRQALTSQISNLQNQIQNQQNALNPEIAQYEKDVQSFKARAAALNSEISDWNSKGGAPKDAYDRLTAEQKNLQAEAAKLNATAQRLNQSTEAFNGDVATLNGTIDTFNQALAQKPEEGLFDGVKNEIYIYFITNQNEFIHTLSHEMGHALGINHVADQNAIMYPYTTKQIEPAQADIDALKTVCKKHSLYELFASRVVFILQHLKLQNAQTN